MSFDINAFITVGIEDTLKWLCFGRLSPYPSFGCVLRLRADCAQAPISGLELPSPATEVANLFFCVASTARAEYWLHLTCIAGRLTLPHLLLVSVVVPGHGTD